MTSLLNCSFCGKREDEVARLVQGPNVTICSDCVALAHDICQGTERARALSKSIEELYDPKLMAKWSKERLEEESRLECKVAGIDSRGRLVLEIYERETGKLLRTHKVRQ